MKVKEVPAVSLAGVTTEKCVAGGAVTLIEFEVPLIAADAASLTEMV